MAGDRVQASIIRREGFYMFRKIVFVAAAAALVPAVAMAAGAKDELRGAIAKLADSPNYGWTTKVEGGFSAGAGEGKTEKNGPTSLAIVFGDETYQVIINGNKAAAKGSGGWASLAELERDSEEDGNGFSVERFLSVTIQNFKTPAAQAKDLCDELEDVQKSGEAYTADLKPETTKKLLSVLRRRAATSKGTQIEVTEPKGSASFWIRDGALAKMETHLQGVVSFNGKERRIDRTTTTVITDVGSTKVTVPEECREKL
jgi:hypothetical protein